jgi:DMSO/TMAO reductase YedYZ molybdopterin-dependent catalytic subunit
VGAVAQLLALCIAFLGSVLGFAFAPVALGQALIEVTPGWISVPLIELLQFWAQRLLVVGVLVGFMACGAVAGALAHDPRRRTRGVLLVGALPWVAAAAGAGAFAASSVPVGATLVDAAVGAAAYFAGLALLETADGVEGVAAGPRAPSRRRALGYALGVAVLVAVGSLASGRQLRAIGARAEAMKQAARRLRFAETVAPADPAFEATPSLTPRLTSIADHYTVDTTLVDPRVEAERWRLEISGAVAEPYSIGYEELLDLEAVEQLHTLECISNEIGGDLISTALWTGVPLAALLERARPDTRAFDVILRSVDGYSDSIRFAKAMEPKTIVAYLMNGYVLPEEHGFPARLLVPNIYGMKNVKWLTKVEVATNDYLGYWMERGWSDLAVVNTHSRIDTPRTVKLDDSHVTLAGIANAGARGVSRVEVSADGGGSWADAELEPALGPLTWRRWRLVWTPPGPGKYTVLVRATDGEGQVQTATRRPPFPSGSTGYDSVDLTVAR